MAYGGYSFGKCKNGGWVCGSDFPPRFFAGARHAYTKKWVIGWESVEHGADPSVAPPAYPHRCPEAASPQDAVSPQDAWDTYFQNLATAEPHTSVDVAMPSPTADVTEPDQLTAVLVDGDYSHTGTQQLTASPPSYVPAWSEPVELRPCSTLALVN